jgi:hypothetical protein
MRECDLRTSRALRLSLAPPAVLLESLRERVLEALAPKVSLLKTPSVVFDARAEVVPEHRGSDLVECMRTSATGG